MDALEELIGPTPRNIGMGDNSPPDEIALLRERLETTSAPLLLRRDELLAAGARVPATIETEELCGIVILLYCWAMMCGLDLHAEIDRKMAKNRSRQWNILPDGTGRHT